MTRRYLPSSLPRLAEDWAVDGPRVVDPVLAPDDGEESEYVALMTAADASAELVAGLPDGPITWREVVAVHVDTTDDAHPDDDLAWWATQEIGDLLASLSAGP